MTGKQKAGYLAELVAIAELQRDGEITSPQARALLRDLARRVQVRRNRARRRPCPRRGGAQ